MAEWIMVVATVALVFVTAAYVALTKRLVASSETALRESTRAFVLVAYKGRGNLLLLLVRNYGLRAARALTFEVTYVGADPEGSQIAGLGAAQRMLGRGLSALAPGETHYIDVGPVSGMRQWVTAHPDSSASLEIVLRYHDGYQERLESQTISPKDVLATEFRTPVYVEMDDQWRIAQALEALAGTSSGVVPVQGGATGALRDIASAIEAVKRGR